MQNFEKEKFKVQGYNYVVVNENDEIVKCYKVEKYANALILKHPHYILIDLNKEEDVLEEEKIKPVKKESFLKRLFRKLKK